ncbi:carbohydrate binding family 9 domain-containing protein, partial [bacterium]|nr:carbohydrate binding family 9 domain-containing protein [bacterium]
MPAKLFLFLVALLTLFGDSTYAEPVYEVTAGPADHIKIDGHLEVAWFSGGVVEGFVQREPHYPDPVSQTTRVYLLSDNDALYFGFLCNDTAPDSIRGKIQRRDNDDRSDFVDIYLDSFHDRRSGYWYTVTAAGVQAEGTIANEKEFTADWDAVWQSAVARSDSGWSCEIRIPFQSIRHGGARADGWGIGFARYIERRAERTFWPPVDPQKDFYLSQVGTLYGLKNIASPAHIEVLPHAVGRWDAEANDGEWHSENEYENLGFYLKAVPSAAMTLDFAYEPDFAQVDVDAQEINLSDYPIFLSEKRPFFLENKQLFEELPYYLFYTRRITDPDYAGRLNLQKGRVRASIIA